MDARSRPLSADLRRPCSSRRWYSGRRALLVATGARAVVVAVALTLVLAAPTQAQEAASDEAAVKPWTNEAELSFVRTSGNTTTTSLSFADRFAYNWTYSELVVRASLLKASRDLRVLTSEDGVVTADFLSEDIAEAYDFNGQYRRNVFGNLFWYIGAGWYRNEFAGLSNRYHAGAGFGYRFVENERSTAIGEIGVNLTREEQTNLSEDTYVEVRGFLGVKHKLNDNTDFATDLEILPNVTDFEDLRLNSVTSLSARLTGVLALRIGLTIHYDRLPVVFRLDSPTGVPAFFTLQTTDTLLSTALVLKF